MSDRIFRVKSEARVQCATHLWFASVSSVPLPALLVQVVEMLVGNFFSGEVSSPLRDGGRSLAVSAGGGVASTRTIPAQYTALSAHPPCTMHSCATRSHFMPSTKAQRTEPHAHQVTENREQRTENPLVPPYLPASRDASATTVTCFLLYRSPRR